MLKCYRSKWIEAHSMKNTALEWFQDRVGKVSVPKWMLWKVSAGSSENIRPAVAEMRRAINKSS